MAGVPRRRLLSGLRRTHCEAANSFTIARMGAGNRRCRQRWRCARELLVCMVLAASFPATAQDASGIGSGGPRMVTAEARRLVTMPAYPTPPVAAPTTPPQQPRETSPPLTIETFDTPSHRIHVVSMAGKTWKAAAPLDGPRYWLAFDPARHAFAELLPSIRVELGNGVEPQAIAKAVDAAGIEVFDTLGFAIVTLPQDLHPAEAVARVEALPGQPKAAMRLRGPRIQWR